jgi:meso-butanediol dehydrogenase / (S,S)-butanediol dehydrogenase / diacetyl reductase
VRGLVHGVRAALPALRAQGGGAIVVTASVAGLRGSPQTWAYSASKAAVINLVRCLALDYAREGIRVNAVAPGLTVSRLTERARSEPAVRDALTERIPLGRWADAAEQAEAIHFLASPAASYITGEVLAVDGGIDAGSGLVPPARGAGEAR